MTTLADGLTKNAYRLSSKRQQTDDVVTADSCDSTVESHECSAVTTGQSEEIAVGELPTRLSHAHIRHDRRRERVRPELV